VEARYLQVELVKMRMHWRFTKRSSRSTRWRGWSYKITISELDYVVAPQKLKAEVLRSHQSITSYLVVQQKVVLEQMVCLKVLYIKQVDAYEEEVQMRQKQVALKHQL
jgi:hypothetical protein